jgi:hypothetical protein
MKNYPYKILAKVKFNSSIAIVIDSAPRLEYIKTDGIIYGTDGLFYNCYYYDSPGPNWKAFAGRKFDIHLKNGQVEHCYGQWWHGGHKKVGKMVGANLCHITYQTLDRLKSCYVFTGDSVDESKWSDFLSSFDVPLYEYWDYEKIIKYDDMRSSLLSKILKLEKDKRHLVNTVKNKHRLLKDLEDQTEI